MMGPGSAAHRHSVSKTRVNALMALRSIRGTRRCRCEKRWIDFASCGLLASTVLGARRGARLETIPGAPPRLDHLAPGCAFAPRCPIVAPACGEGDIAAVTLAPGRTARCIRVTAAA